jgi:prepilin peptidase CpaA
MNPATIYLGAALLCALAGAVYDWRYRRIPNALTRPAALLGLGLHLVLGGWPAMSAALLAGLVAGGVFLLFFLAGGMGGGDVKLIAAVLCCAGWQHVAEILIATALAGGIMALALALTHGRLRQTVSNVGTLLLHHASAGLGPHSNLHVRNAQTLRLPYGIAICAGTAMTLLSVVQGR